MSAMTRRKFLKRTGAATVATFVALNLSISKSKADEDNGQTASQDYASDQKLPCGTWTFDTRCEPSAQGQPNDNEGGIEVATTGLKVITVGGVNYKAQVTISAPGVDEICRRPRQETFVTEAKIWNGVGVLLVHLRIDQMFRIRCVENCTKARVSKYPTGPLNNIISGNADVPKIGVFWDVILICQVSANGGDVAGVTAWIDFQNTSTIPVEKEQFPVAGVVTLNRENMYQCCSLG